MEKFSKNLISEYEKAEKLFLELANGLILAKNGGFYNPNKEWMMLITLEKKAIYLSYFRFWQKFEIFFDGRDEAMKWFFEDMLYKYFKITGLRVP